MDPDFNERKDQFLREFGEKLEAHRAGSTTGEPTGLPKLDESNFSATWIPTMQADFQAFNIPESSWVTGGMLYLPDEVERSVSTRRKTDWTWDQFNNVVQAVLDSARTKRIVTNVAGVALGAVLAPPIIVGGLGMLGFGAVGVAAGSAAAAIQSVFYGGATTGLFSVCQAIGATGAVGPVGVAISGAVGGAVAKLLPSNRR